MAVRNKRKCRNCPEEAAPMTSVAPQPPQKVFQLSSETEGPRLWGQVLIGAHSFVGMIEGYCNFGMPGAPIESINGLVARLQEVLKKIEAENEVQSDPQRLSLDERDRASGGVVEQETAREERPGDQPLSAEYVVSNERVSE